MLLIDGHNLIGQLEDLSLDDPYDEAKLSMAIRTYCMRSKEKATVIFDNGLPGGVSKELSNSSVKVIFAPPGVQADSLLMRRAKEMINPNDPLVLITSDRRILRLAFAYGLDTLSSSEFAILIGFRPIEIDPEANKPPETKQFKIVYEKDPDPVVSQQEVNYWLPIFEMRVRKARAAQLIQQQQEREQLRQKYKKNGKG